MKNLVLSSCVSAMSIGLAMSAVAGDKKRETKKPADKKQVETKRRSDEAKARASQAKQEADAKRKADAKKREADAKRKAEAAQKAKAEEKKRTEAARAAALKKQQEELEKKRAEAKKKYEEEQKKRAAASALSRRLHSLPRLYWDLELDEKQLAKIEAFQKRLESGLKAKYDEQKKLFERGRELRKESEGLRTQFDKDVLGGLNPAQRKIVSNRIAELEAKRRAWEAKRAAELKEAQKKREAQQRAEAAKKKK